MLDKSTKLCTKPTSKALRLEQRGYFKESRIYSSSGRALSWSVFGGSEVFPRNSQGHKVGIHHTIYSYTPRITNPQYLQAWKRREDERLDGVFPHQEPGGQEHHHAIPNQNKSKMGHFGHQFTASCTFCFFIHCDRCVQV